MRRIGKWLWWMTLVLLGLVVGLWMVSRMRGPSTAQTEALALMQQRAEHPSGGNAFPALWLLPYDVPHSQLQAVTDADVAQLVAAASSSGNPYSNVIPNSTAAGRFEDQSPSSADAQLFCTSRDEDCLGRVRADPKAYDGLMERNQALLDRVAALQSYGYYQSPAPAGSIIMTPPFQAALYGATRAAWQFSKDQASNDQIDVALTGACDGAHLWRRLGAHSDSLMARDISAAYFDLYARLFARMLGELPSSQPLPASCDLAFAPPTVADASICEAMRGEFSVSNHFIGQVDTADTVSDSWIDRALPMSLVWDAEKTSAIMAAGNAWSCSQDTSASLRDDIRVNPGSSESSLLRLECVANPIGCGFSHVAFSAYYNYQWVAQDHAARIELVRALLWLRANADPGEPLQAQLMRYWEQNRRSERQIRFEDDGRSVALQRYVGSDEWWSFPFFPEGG